MNFLDYWLLATIVSFLLFMPVPYLRADIHRYSLFNVGVCLILAMAFGWVLWPFQVLHAIGRNG